MVPLDLWFHRDRRIRGLGHRYYGVRIGLGMTSEFRAKDGCG